MFALIDWFQCLYVYSLLYYYYYTYMCVNFNLHVTNECLVLYTMVIATPIIYYIPRIAC
jgi:hypothetical protein